MAPSSRWGTRGRSSKRNRNRGKRVNIVRLMERHSKRRSIGRWTLKWAMETDLRNAKSPKTAMNSKATNNFFIGLLHRKSRPSDHRRLSVELRGGGSMLIVPSAARMQTILQGHHTCTVVCFVCGAAIFMWMRRHPSPSRLFRDGRAC